MSRVVKSIAVGVSIMVAFCGMAMAEQKARVIDWETLLPENERGAAGGTYQDENVVPLFEGDDSGPGHVAPGIQMGSSRTVAELDGEYVRIPGFMLPLQYAKGGVVTEFLLVPYFGACIHVPPPPPNQIVYVQVKDPVKSKGMWDPIWAVGTLRTKMAENDLGDAAYTLELDFIEPYED